MILEFTVYGVAHTKGSARAFVNKRTGRAVVTNDNPKAKGWQSLIREGAERALHAHEAPELLDRAVRLSVAFYLPRPKKFQRRGVQPAHLTIPDLDKLVRVVLDALTAVAWLDDKFVVELLASKHYADVDALPHVRIRVEPTRGAEPVRVPAVPLPLFTLEAGR